MTIDAIGNSNNSSVILTAIDALRAMFPQAQVTTYSYISSQLSSKTDPNGKMTTYEYDPLGRLIVIRDHEGKILKSFKYKYRSEP